VSCDHRVPAGAGRATRADELAARLPRHAWQRLSAGAGAKGSAGTTGPGSPSPAPIRWVTLAMLALAFLSVTAAAEHAQPPPPGLIPITATRSPGSSNP
jgi:hypothetical protein